MTIKRYLLLLVLVCSIQSCSSQHTPKVKSDSYRDGIKITYSQHYKCHPGIVCSKSDSSFIKQRSGNEWTIYIRGDQMRLEFPSDYWDYIDTGIAIYPGKSELNSFSCYRTKYFNYYVEIDSTMDQLQIIHDYRRRPWFEKLPDTLTVSGFKCKSGIYHDGYQKWLIHYTDDIPKLETPHKLELRHNYSLLQHAFVPHFIVQKQEIKDTSKTYNSTTNVETVTSVEHLPLHDSLFRPPSDYKKIKNWNAAKAEYMKHWEADLTEQLATNPVTQKEKEAFYGHWVYESEHGLYYLNIKPNSSPERYGDTCFVKDFMFRKNERSSGTLGTWRTKMMGRTLFHEFGRSWSYNKERDELVHNYNESFVYRRATAEETTSSLRECDLVWAAWDMADSLKKWGYAKVLVENNGHIADSLWNMPDGEEILKRVAYRTGSRRIERFIAAEIVFRKDPTYPPKDDEQLLHDLSHAYANALSYDYAPYGEYWGNIRTGTIGICGEHLLRIGTAAIPELTRQTLNQEFDFYLKYKSGEIGTLYVPRKKDHAAFFLSRLINEPYAFKREKTERDADIEVLRKKLKFH
jgi:hypothetical protein